VCLFVSHAPFDCRTTTTTTRRRRRRRAMSSRDAWEEFYFRRSVSSVTRDGSGMEEAPEIHGARRRAGLARSVLKALARTFLGLAHYATTDDYETALEATQELYYGGCDF
jgi:hypothetical protein